MRSSRGLVAGLILLAFGTQMAAFRICRSEDIPATVDLTGNIHDSEGKPVPGATVLVWTAGVKKGYSTFCPSCYADCGKRAATDDNGAFAIGRLSSELRFRLLIVKDGFAPTFIEKVDPASGPVSGALPRRELPSDVKQVVRGRVVDSAGDPIANAIVEPEMVWFLNENGGLGGSGGAVKGLDPVAVSNDVGEFQIAYAKPAVKMTLIVKSRGKAPKRFVDLATGDKWHELPLSSGATISGRLVHRGKPISGAEMGLVSQDRGMGEYYSEERIGTRNDGTFEFVNVPVPVNWYVYAKMASIVQHGAATAISTRTARDDERIELGNIEIHPGNRLRGQVLLTDGKPIPDGMRITISAERAWDSQTAVLPPDGTFEFLNVPNDQYSISPSVKGYRLSPENPNLSWSIEGVVNRDIDDFVILLDPGQDDFKGRFGGKFRGKPLRGAKRP